MSNKAITEIQSNNEECNFLQPHIGEGLNSKFFKIVRVGLFLLFIWTLIEIFKAKNTVEVIINSFCDSHRGIGTNIYGNFIPFNMFNAVRNNAFRVNRKNKKSQKQKKTDWKYR